MAAYTASAYEAWQQHELGVLLNSTMLYDPGPGKGPTYISPQAVGLAALLIVVNGIISVWLSLDLHFQLAIAAVRCVLQLTVLGYILVPIFTKHVWWLVLMYSVFMLLVGCYEAVSRPPKYYRGILAHTLSAVGSACAVFMAYGMVLVVQQHPWWEPQYFIPILGMMLGNCISGVSIGLSTVMEELSTGKDRIELLLAYGGSRWEATRDTVQRSVKVALTPMLNQMNVVGVVSIPGMMTGQILSGSDPSQAARYQMIIMFLLAAGVGVGSVSTILMAVFTVVDMRHRLRSEIVLQRDTGGWLPKPLQQASQKVTNSLHRASSSMGRALQRRGRRDVLPDDLTSGLLGGRQQRTG